MENTPSSTAGRPSLMSRPATRCPQRITITVPWQLYQRLIEISDQQGRSLSNLACFWLEQQSGER
jgi:hypothetical protein